MSMSIKDAASSHHSTPSKSSSSKSTSSSSPAATAPLKKEHESVATAPQDRVTVDRVAANDGQTTERVANVVAGLTETGSQDPNAGALARIDELTRADHAKYGGQTTEADGTTVIKPGVQEGQSPLREDIGRMWESVGVKNRDGTADVPWSAAYISDVMKRAGVDNFQGSQRHSEYISGAISARQNEDKEASHWGYRTSERAPQAGDLVCFARADSGASFDQQQGGQYKSHCDIVQGVRPGFIDTIGGNVGESVSTRSFTTDENGLINDPAKSWIAVLAPQMLGTQ